MMRDDQLAELLRDTVSGIEPTDRLHEIRSATRSSGRPRRATAVAIGGAVLASAAAVVAVAVMGDGVLPTDDPSPAGGSSASSPADSTASDPTSGATPAAVRAVAVYYVGDAGPGPRLYREFRSVEEPDDGPGASLDLLTTTPLDPDYRTLWPADAFAGGSVEGDRITVELGDASLTQRPAGMSDDDATLAVQQAVYTLQAYAQQRLPVEFTVGGEPTETVLGVATPEPVAAAPVLQTLSLVNLTRPEEGARVSDTLLVEGVANSFEATVPWAIEDSSGEVVDEYSFTAEGSMGDRLWRFTGEIDVSALPAGSYTLRVSTDDPTGGAEGVPVSTDTRTIVVD